MAQQTNILVINAPIGAVNTTLIATETGSKAVTYRALIRPTVYSQVGPKTEWLVSDVRPGKA